MISLKEGVDLRGIQPPLLAGIIIVQCYLQYKKIPFVITSVSDPAVGRLPNSLHKSGLAFDFRTRNFPHDFSKDDEQCLKRLLGLQFDVVLEDDHCHVEFDPVVQ